MIQRGAIFQRGNNEWTLIRCLSIVRQDVSMFTRRFARRRTVSVCSLICLICLVRWVRWVLYTRLRWTCCHNSWLIELNCMQRIRSQFCRFGMFQTTSISVDDHVLPSIVYIHNVQLEIQWLIGLRIWNSFIWCVLWGGLFHQSFDLLMQVTAWYEEHFFCVVWGSQKVQAIALSTNHLVLFPVGISWKVSTTSKWKRNSHHFKLPDWHSHSTTVNVRHPVHRFENDDTTDLDQKGCTNTKVKSSSLQVGNVQPVWIKRLLFDLITSRTIKMGEISDAVIDWYVGWGPTRGFLHALITSNKLKTWDE